MNKDYGNQPYISPEQEKLMNTLIYLSSRFKQLVSDKRSKALGVLLDEKKSSDAKISTLDEYFDFRMNPGDYSVTLGDGNEYGLLEMQNIANKLYEDPTFAYSESPWILNNRDFFFESITVHDVVLGYHYYRLTRSDESLSHFVKLIGYYTQYAFEMDELKTDYSIPNGVLNHEDAITLMGRILSFFDELINQYGNKYKSYNSQFDLGEDDRDDRTDYVSRIDGDAAEAMSKRSAVDIRIDKLFEFLSSCEGYNWQFAFELRDILLPALFGEIDLFNNGSVIHTKPTTSDTIERPTLSDLVDLAKTLYDNRKEKQSDSCLEYKRVYEFLNDLLENGAGEFFDENSAITEEDEDQARRIGEKIDLDHALGSIRRDIRFLFVIKNAAEIIPEFACNKDAIWRRRKNCRQLCSIYTDEGAFETITGDKEIDEYNSLAEAEGRINKDKLELYRSFLMIPEMKSIEGILKRHTILLDQAKGIDPLDFSFLEKCSMSILSLLQTTVDRQEDVSSFEIKTREMLESGKKSILSKRVLHTLATAELLFARYASDYYAEQGFDYSCISALYYQAVENAYNELIWEKYASYLNELKIDGKEYTDILNGAHAKYYKGRIEKGQPGFGYLPQDEKGWSFYTTFDKKKRIIFVDSTCMFGPFVMLIGGVYNDNTYSEKQIPNFYRWLAKQLNFTSDSAMMHNPAFVEKLKCFRNDMSAAVEPRNNASHGGSEIDINQCKNDKNTVLSDLQEVRKTNLGLINQLVDIMQLKN